MESIDIVLDKMHTMFVGRIQQTINIIMYLALFEKKLREANKAQEKRKERE